MDRLKNKTILIGKEPSNGQLLIYIPEIKKYGVIGNPGTVPNSVSRCKIQEGIAHAKIFVDQNGNMTLTNIKPQNTTYVNGSEIIAKRISASNTVELGKDHYLINVSMVLELANKLVGSIPPPPPPPLDISHLGKVWKNYESEMDRIAIAQQELQKKRMMPIMVSSSSALLSGIGALVAVNSLWITLPLGGVVSYMYFKNYNKKDTSHEDRKRAISDLQHHYVAPCCNHIFPAVEYEILKNQLINPKDKKMYCPKCKHELIEKK